MTNAGTANAAAPAGIVQIHSSIPGGAPAKNVTARATTKMSEKAARIPTAVAPFAVLTSSA
jgi:hypothetical protein